MWLLDNPVRDYAWGSTTAIPEFLSQPATGTPMAEVWMGAHPAAPSRLVGSELTLDQKIAQDPAAMLGPGITGDRLPYLVKYLAPAQALSLQVHPNPEQAVAGFAAEEAAGVPRDAKHRRYRDDQAKPELMLALTPFQSLYGFRSETAIGEDLDACTGRGIAELRKIWESEEPVSARLANIVEWTLTDGPHHLDVADVVQQVISRSGADRAKALTGILERYPGDAGAVVACLMNHVSLEPGEGLFVGAGVIHSYLEGFGLEVMAASDNVLRAGLTAKHVDVPELLSLLHCEPSEVLPVRAVDAPDFGTCGAKRWSTPAPHFQLHQVNLSAGESTELQVSHATIITSTAGELTISHHDSADLTLSQGSAAFLPPSPQNYRVAAAPGQAVASVIGPNLSI